MKTNTTIAALAIALNSGLSAETKAIEMGNSFLGAKLTGTASAYSPANAGYADIYTSAKGTGSAFWQSFDLGGGAANLRMSATGQNVQAWGYLKIGSKTLTTWNKTIPMSGGSFSTTPFIAIQEGGHLDLEVIELGVDATVTLKATGVVATKTIGGKPTTNASFGPVLDAVVSGDASVNIGIASGGVIGSVKLCHADLTATASMASAGKVMAPFDKTLTYGVNFNTTTMDGKITLWADSPFITKQTKTYSWKGFSNTYNLTSGSLTLSGTPILK